MQNRRRPRPLELLLDEDYAVDIGHYLNRGFEIFQRDLGPFIGFSLLSNLIAVATTVIPTLGLVSTAISPPLAAGPWIYAFKGCRGQARVFSDFFRGFNYWVALLVTTLLIGFLSLLLMLPFLILVTVQAIQTFAPLWREAEGQLGSNDQILASPMSEEYLWQLLPWILFVSLVIVVIGMGIRLIYLFAFPLILDRKLEFWPAMETSRRIVAKRWGSLLGLLVVVDLINLAGALLVLIGLIFTIPLTNCILVATYEDIVGLEAETY